jgi:hypothetical protein
MARQPAVRIISFIEHERLNRPSAAAHKLVAKFIVISDDVELTLILGLVSDYPYHADLVAHFCRNNDIASGWTRKPDLYEILEQRWKVQGGGWANIDVAAGCWEFFGHSSAYGAYDRSDLCRVLSDHSFFTGCSIAIA